MIEECLNIAHRFLGSRYHAARGLLVDTRGFTLVEMLVSLLLLSLMMSMMYASYAAIIKGVKIGTEETEFYENLNLAIMKIDRDFANTYYNRDNKINAFVGEMDGENSKVNFVTVDHRERNELGGPTLPCHRSDVHQVGYYLKPSQYAGELNLIKQEKILYDDDLEKGWTENVVLEGVTELKFEYQVGNDWTNRWDSRDSKRAPQTVKVTLKVKHAFTGANNQKEQKIEEFFFISRMNMVR